MSVKSTVRRDSLSNFVGLSLNTLMQLVQIPVLTSVWSVHDYGIWLMLSTIPAYVAVSDIGFAAAATSSMAMSYALNDVNATRRIYQSIWALHIFASIFIIILFLSIALIYPGLANGYAKLACLFAVYALMGFCARATLAGYRAVKLYAVGAVAYDVTSFVEGLSVICIALAGGSFEQCVVANIVIRAASMLTMTAFLGQRRPFMRFGFDAASFNEIRRLFRPAIAAAVPPIAIAMNIQGMVLLVGALLSPSAVAILSPVRTASRLALQIVGAINRGTMATVSASLANGNASALGHAVKMNVWAVCFVLMPLSCIFAAFGGEFVHWWTNYRVAPGNLFVLVMAITAFIHGLWYFASNLLLASSEHISLAAVIPVITISSFGLAIPCAYFWGLEGVGLAICLGEFACLLMAARALRESSLWKMWVTQCRN